MDLAAMLAGGAAGRRPGARGADMPLPDTSE
jgi:26S proteasome regulatory subunit N11